MKSRYFFGLSPILATIYCPPALADSGGYGHMGDWFPGMGGHWMPGLFWLLILVVIVVIALRWVSGAGDSRQSDPAPNALEILKRRYAKGEIDEDEFLRKRAELER